MEGAHSPEPSSRRFRFKDKSKSSRRKRAGPDTDDLERDTKPKRRKHSSNDGSHSDSDYRRESRRRSGHKGSRSRREKTKAKEHPTVYDRTFKLDGTYMDPDNRRRESLYDDVDDTHAPYYPSLDPATAFRESLFDALADDEGAAYWEGVYGQPIHIYENTKTGPKGELEQMTEEEYAEHVRRKMWEKTHEHIMEEREAREKARKERKKRDEHLRENGDRLEAEREAFQRRVQESLKKGEDRKKMKAMAAAWSNYLARWDDLRSTTKLADESAAAVRELIPWPVVSGRFKDVSKDEIEHFIKHSSAPERTAMLKSERVRWHPDKMQHRFGQHIDTETMKAVTAVFQVIDRLWDEQRERK
jgi:hypothetical protein